MNNVLIFAGGTGVRMNAEMPKQFMVVHGKPVIIHTLEKFNSCLEINKIVVVCLSDYIDYLKDLILKFKISKVVKVVSGGKTGQESIYNGLKYLHDNVDQDGLVLIHDGVRPLIDEKTIKKNIEIASKFGNCITSTKSQETIIYDGDSPLVLDRSNSYLGRAPQTFRIKDIYNSHLKAISEKKFNFVDSAMLMTHYGFKLNIIEGPKENIKITTPLDYFLFKAILDAQESSINFGDKYDGKTN